MSDSDQHAQGEGPEAAIREFGRAAGRTVTALAVAASSDGATALSCVFALHEAFGQLTSALAVLPEVITRADAGSRVEAQLMQRKAEIAAATAGLAAVHANLDALSDAERELDVVEAERSVLAARLAELEQASARAAQLSAMREHIVALEAAVSPTDATDDLTARLMAALTLLQQLTGQQRAALGPRLERIIGDAQTAGEDLKSKQARKEELDADFDRLEKQSAEITAAIQHELPALAEWRKADAAIADALATADDPDSGTTERLRVTLADLTERMKAIEETLAPLHSAYIRARDEALAIRNLSTPTSAPA